MSDHTTPAPDVPDVRVYLHDPALWTAVVKQTTEKLYCYQRNPGEDYFHLILKGELYLENGDEKLCLRCALRRDALTQDRLSWQHRVGRRPPPVV
jgi:hypothetical protein